MSDRSNDGVGTDLPQDALKRRRIMQFLASLGSWPLVGCGGSDTPAEDTGSREAPTPTPATPTASPTPEPPAPTPATPSPPSAPASPAVTPLLVFAPTGQPRFGLISATTQSEGPFTIGYCFKQGEIPIGKSAVSSALTLQCVPKTYWPDRSVRFAILSGRAPLTANLYTTVRMEAGTAAGGTALTLADLRATGITASFSAGSFGAADWTTSAFADAFIEWVSGPEMSSWVFRKPFSGDDHLVAFMEVRLYRGGAVEVLPWVENGYLSKVGPTNKRATYVFKLGATERFNASVDLPHHCRTPLVSGTALSFWLATDPGIVPKHDTLYMQATEMVPTYRVTQDPSADSAMITTYTPLQVGNIVYDNDAMSSTGYQPPIGLLPAYDATYITNQSAKTYGVVIRNGYSAGRWAIHYRDETTNRPLRFSAYPYRVIRDQAESGIFSASSSSRNDRTPSVSGTRPPLYDIAHSPAFGYMAYLVSGLWYFMEQVQFQATANYMTQNDDEIRNFSMGRFMPVTDGQNQTRAQAWGFRTLMHALLVTPESDSVLRDEFKASVESNIALAHSRYVAQPNNLQGWTQPGESYTDPQSWRVGATWQQDFITASWGWALAMALPVSADMGNKLREFFHWKAQSIVGRLGKKGDFWFINAAQYVIQISSANYPDYRNGTAAGFYRTWAEVYAASAARADPGDFGSTDNVLAGPIAPTGNDGTSAARSFWGNLQPAIAYAVRHGVTGAKEAYKRMLGASNWPLLEAGFKVSPVWGIKPALGDLPAWLDGQPLLQWIPITGTNVGVSRGLEAYSGWAFREDTSELIAAACGGHGDSSDNAVYSIRLTDDNPAWVVRTAASATPAKDVDYYADGKPSSRHTYSYNHWVPQLNRVMMFGATYTYGTAVTFARVDGWNPDTNQWDPKGTWPDLPALYESVICIVPSTGEGWRRGFGRWRPGIGYDNPIASVPTQGGNEPMCYDSARDQLFSVRFGNGQDSALERGLTASIIRRRALTMSTVSFNPSSGLDQLLADKTGYPGMCYDPANDCFFYYDGRSANAIGNVSGGPGRIFKIVPNSGTTWDVQVVQSAQVGGAAVPATLESGINSRFTYVPALKGIVMMPSRDAGLFFMRTAV